MYLIIGDFSKMYIMSYKIYLLNLKYLILKSFILN